MRVIAALLRWFSYLYQLILCGFFLGLSLLTYMAPGATLQLEMLPWTEDTIAAWLLILSLLGLTTLVLAVLGKLRVLFVLWCLLVLILMIRGYFFSGYYFSGVESFQTHMWLVAGALLALAGSVMGLRSRRRS